MKDDEICFTVVFEGNLRDRFQGNPFGIRSPFGRPISIGVGDAFTRVTELECLLKEATEEKS